MVILPPASLLNICHGPWPDRGFSNRKFDETRGSHWSPNLVPGYYIITRFDEDIQHSYHLFYDYQFAMEGSTMLLYNR